MLKELNKQSAFVQLRIEGKTLIDIANELEISLSTANRLNKMFKSEICDVRNTELNILRKKIASRYEAYFDFLNTHFQKLNEEINLHEEITMSYEDLLSNTLKVLDAINKIDVFKKFSEKTSRENYHPPDSDEIEKLNSYISKDRLEKLKRL
ncbi:MAG: hypothetical protein PHN88_15580 [Ignavibacteria bacterium]|nr:hypothetical protein [Ignavibacteria bacterium]